VSILEGRKQKIKKEWGEKLFDFYEKDSKNLNNQDIPSGTNENKFKNSSQD
jgi:hypothetical protein